MGTQSIIYPRPRPTVTGRRQPVHLGPFAITALRRAGARILIAFALGVTLLAPEFSVQAQTNAISASSAPLILPGGLGYDAQGNLYFAESGRNLVRRVALDGTLITFAGTGVQGFAGDGGTATAADLDSPQAVAVDSAGNVFVADTHNHRIRRIDANSGFISTVAVSGTGTGPFALKIGLPSALAVDSAGNLFVADAAQHRILRLDAASGALAVVAGNGTQGYSGDGGPASSAAIDSPYGLALDPQGNLFLSDTHNQCVRRVDHVSGLITTIAGTGQPGFAGDSGAATSATLRLPRGLAIDGSGNLFLVDSANHRLRRIDAVTGLIASVAGDGTQAYAGDAGPAVSASLDSPRAVALSPAGLATMSDTHNQRVRQVDTQQAIHTIAGLGTGGTAILNLFAPAAIPYGSGQAAAHFVANPAASPATGNVTFFDQASGAATRQTVASVALVGNTAVLSLATLAAGTHHLSATYPGDATHVPAQSQAVSVNIATAAAIATPNAVSMFYGMSVPALTGSLTGILPQDAPFLSLVLSSSATPVAPPGSYPVQAALSGGASADYALTTTPAAVVINKASASTTLSQALTVHVASNTSGVPSGPVNLIDGATVAQTAVLNATGDVNFSASSLTTGSHTLTAAYPGDRNFLSASSAPLLLSTGPGTAPDFTLAASGQTSATVVAGNAATFAFAVSPLRGALNSPIQLNASGLPPGASASFSPAYLPPTGNPSAFVLTVQTLHAATVLGGSAGAMNVPASVPYTFALGLPLLLLLRRKGVRKILICVFACSAGALLLNGCASRTNSAPASASIQVYTITVTGTSTADSGATLQHTASVTLSVQ